jgi:hypothetical protein
MTLPPNWHLMLLTFYFLIESLLTLLKNLPIFACLNGTIEREVSVSPVSNNSIIESLVLKTQCLLVLTSPMYSQISVNSGRSIADST